MQDKQTTFYLYKITNKVNDKVYIGVTNNPDRRKSQHFSKTGSRLVNEAVNKYGRDNFGFEVICVGSKEYIYDLEKKAIGLYNSNATNGHGYNLCDGGVVNNQTNKGKSILKRKDDTPVFVSGFWFPSCRVALKSLNWGQGKYNSRKKKGILGEIKIPELTRSDDEFVYALGFWFPNKRTALSKLTISPNVYERRRKEGSLGSVVAPNRKSNSTALAVPNYFKGFWFPNLFIASAIFNIRPETIRQRILRGYFEECGKKSKQDMPSRKYCILGNTYDSLQDASNKLNIPETTIKNRLSNKVDGYDYIYTI